MLAVETVIVG